MGFYFELERSEGHGEIRYAEGRTPGIFWTLYLFLGFALACMGLAAHRLLGDLLASGDWYDRLLVTALYACLPGYLVLGLWLALVKRYLAFGGEWLRVGRTAAGREWTQRRLARKDIARVDLLNRKPSPNYASRDGEDTQFHIRGHWRVVAWPHAGGTVTLDKHTDRELLEPLLKDLRRWLDSAA